MADAVTEEKTLVIQNDNGQDTVYKLVDMSDEAKTVYAKLELVTNQVNTLKNNVALQIEQLTILQGHYLEAIKPLLSSGEVITEKGKSNESSKAKTKK
tara:strand:- start:1271 stop:1564 length:294 start_codon:yes stop_codon:yes gene_type:complete